MERNSCVPASYVVFFQSTQILLLRRANTGYEDGNYSLVAGHVENGESFSQCAIREAQEEAGIVIQEHDLEEVHTMYRKKTGENSTERIDVFFRAKKWGGTIKNMEPTKCDHLSWFDVTSLPKNTIPYIRKAIGNIVTNTRFSEYGWKAEEI
jgi:8-oxo-dGTP diphosphatase